jgi:hypothetical protein
MSLKTFIKDPQAILDIRINWATWLAGLPVSTDTISSSVWTVPVGITKVSDTNSTTTTTIRLSSGTLGTTYELLNHVVLASGQEDERTIKVKIKNQ